MRERLHPPSSIVPNPPPAGPYDAGDYKVDFLSDDVAVMVHSVAGPEPHWSMHVWQRQAGKWKAVATATVPVEE